jgi:peptidoglycan/xylan/chitin deacetylase (PgdA/CDA1 family)
MTTQNLISDILASIPFDILYKVTKTSILIPYYHMVSDDEVLHIKHLYPHKNIKQFSDDLDFILKNFSPISLYDVLENFHIGKTLSSKTLHLTFDDGFREIHDIIAPILLKKGIPATFFISSGFIDNKLLCYQHKASILAEHIFKRNFEPKIHNNIKKIFLEENLEFNDIKSGILSIQYRDKVMVDELATVMDIDFSDYLSKNKPYLTTEQIKRLIDSGFTIGAHSIDHPLYANLALEEQLHQTLESVTFIKDKFSLNYSVFAFPHSDNGVSKRYFSQIKKSGLVDISFGTSGIIEDNIPNNLQRFSLEKPLLPAENIIALQCAKRLWRIVKDKNKIKRN